MSPRTRSLLIFVIGMGVTAILVLLIGAVITSATKSTQIRDQQQQNSPLIANSDETLQLIKACTTPGLRCYERGQRQLADAVGNVNRVVVLAAACASGPVTKSEAEIQACVIERLSNQQPPRR